MDGKSEKARFYLWDDIVVDSDRAVVTQSGERLTMTAKVFDLLLILLERRGQIVEKAELMELLWPNSFVEEANLAQNVAVLRRALGDNPKAARLIRTIPGRGYEFVGDVSVTNAEPATPVIIDEIKRAETRGRGIGYVLAIGSIAALLIAAGAYFLLGRDSEPQVAGISRVAVLPLKPVNIENRDPIVEFAVAESLILKLSKAQNLSVSALSNVRRYTDPDLDPVTVGRELRADYVVSSNYQSVNGKIRVTSQLFHSQSGRSVETFVSSTDSGDVFVMQDFVANEIGNRLLSYFGNATGQYLAKRGTENEEAYRTYLQAQYLIEKENLTDVEHSIKLFDKALELDSNFAAAWAGKGRAHCALSHFSSTTTPDEQYKIAGPAIERALELDPDLAEAYGVKGIIYNDYYWNYEEADKSFHRAWELAPNTASYRRWYSSRAVNYGNPDEAIEAAKKAIDLNPTYIEQLYVYGWVLYRARRYDESINTVESLMETDANSPRPYENLWRAYSAKADGEKAFTAFMKLQERSNRDSGELERYRAAYSQKGWQAVLTAYKDVLKKDRPGENYWPYHYRLGSVAAMSGDRELAFESLNLANKYKSALIPSIKSDAALDSLRDDPRFEDLLKRSGY
ncbi:MAG TPA: winged helix-turn-helix domain-containing protein [Pyrinomonadaceae bacterium]|nr:winged helix-turn-helix domain-containing protein [Pyrinomonadaceae bacterium]